MILTDLKIIKQKLAEMITYGIAALDTETISLEDKTIVGFSFAYRQRNEVVSYYVPLRHEHIKNAPLAETLQLLVKWAPRMKHICFHNSAFDLEVFHHAGIPIYAWPMVHDTLTLAHLLNENDRHGLKQLVKQHFKYQMLELKEICGTGQKQIGFHQLEDQEQIDKYASDDAYWTYKLWEKLDAELKGDDKLTYVYQHLEQPLFKTVAKMHIGGIIIDTAVVKSIKELCERKMDLNQRKLTAILGDINMDSPKQLREWFIGKRKLQPIRYSKRTNEPSVDKAFLEHYQNDNRCPEIAMILEYRKYAKIHSTFIPALTPKTGLTGNPGKIYATFRQNAPKSGRFSSASPNAQNFPRASGDDKKAGLDIRSAFIAEDGHVLVGADFSQIELRILAHFSEDPTLVQAYKTGADIHQQTADATGASRYEAKTLNFGLMYGMSYKSLARNLKIPESNAYNYFSAYWKQYPKVLEFIEATKRQAIDQKYVETLFGRKRRLTRQFWWRDDWEKQGELRSLVNSVIQGTAADMMKLAMILMAPQLESIGARIVMTVHDEVLVSTPQKKLEQCWKIVESAMLEAGNCLIVPVTIDIKWGHTWEQVHSDDGYTLEDDSNEEE